MVTFNFCSNQGVCRSLSALRQLLLLRLRLLVAMFTSATSCASAVLAVARRLSASVTSRSSIETDGRIQIVLAWKEIRIYLPWNFVGNAELLLSVINWCLSSVELMLKFPLLRSVVCGFIVRLAVLQIEVIDFEHKSIVDFRPTNLASLSHRSYTFVCTARYT